MECAEQVQYKAKDFFSHVDQSTTINQFSLYVHLVCSSLHLDKTQKIEILSRIVLLYSDLLSNNAVKHYLDFYKDGELANSLFRDFNQLRGYFGHKLKDGSYEVRLTRKVLAAMKRVNPDARQDFARDALKKFDFPGGFDPKSGRFHGFQKFLRNIAGFSDPPGKVLPLPRPKAVVESKDFKQEKMERHVFLSESVTFVRLSKLPKTGRRKRKWKSFFREAAARS